MSHHPEKPSVCNVPAPTSFTTSFLQVTTVYAKGPYKFTVTSDSSNVEFTGVRFEITGGAEFRLSLASEEFVSTATFTGVTDQARKGNETFPGEEKAMLFVMQCSALVHMVRYSLL